MSIGEDRLYPVFLDLKGRLAVVVGGDEHAERKTKTLVNCGADVVVISPEVGDGIAALEEAELVTVERRRYVRGDLVGARLVLCMTDEEEDRRGVHAEAVEEGVLLSVSGGPELSDFVIPSVVRRGQLQIAVSTAGASPEAAKRVRRRISEEFGSEWAEYVDLLGEVRMLVMQRVIGGAEARRPIFESIADSDLLERLRAGRQPSAEEIYKEFATS